jgi:hypothetical protein
MRQLIKNLCSISVFPDMLTPDFKRYASVVHKRHRSAKRLNPRASPADLRDRHIRSLGRLNEATVTICEDDRAWQKPRPARRQSGAAHRPA